MTARLFLWLVAAVIFITVALAFVWRFAGAQLLSAVLIPNGSFAAAAAGPPFDYALPASWAARPGLAGDPTIWHPEAAPKAAVPAKITTAAVFFIPPTAALDTAQWNGRSDQGQTATRLAGFLRTEASALAAAGPVWAPHYRQAVLGSFVAEDADDLRSAAAARELAYADVAAAFAVFLAAQAPDAPIILAGHSQGSLHLMRLLQEQAAGQPLAARVAAAYLVGWPVSVRADLPALGLPACTARAQAGCILSWQSFGEPAEPESLLAVYNRDRGLNGTPRRGTAMLCTNPLTGAAGGAAPASANPGSLVPSASLAAGRLVTPGVPARCDARGLLLIGETPTGYPAFVLPGNNLHVFDYPLFWQAVRDDVAARVAAWQAAR